jgi:hypothetical protein
LTGLVQAGENPVVERKNGDAGGVKSQCKNQNPSARDIAGPHIDHIGVDFVVAELVRLFIPRIVDPLFQDPFVEATDRGNNPAAVLKFKNSVIAARRGSEFEVL